MKERVKLFQKLFFTIVIVGIFTCVPFIGTVTGMGDISLLSFILLTIITLYLVRKEKQIKKEGLYLILISFTLLIIFVSAVFFSTKTHSLNIYNVYTYSISSQLPYHLLISFIGIVGASLCFIGIVYCYFEYLKLKSKK